MRTRKLAFLIAMLLVLGFSVAAFAQPRGDPPRDDVPTLGTTTELSTPTAPVREHQRDVMNDQACDRVADPTTTCTPDRDRDRVRTHDRDRAQDEDRECTPRAGNGWVEQSPKGAPHRHRSAN